MSPAGAGPPLLAADVGGTTTRFGLFRTEAGALRALEQATLASDPAAAFEDLLRAFLAGAGSPVPAAACVAVAGPVIDGSASMTNHPWVLDARVVARALDGAATLVVNDLEATALGMLDLPAERIHVLAAGAGLNRRGNVGVLAPGTGLGCAALCFDGDRHHPLASEGGHGDFAPRDEEQVALWRHLAAQHGHVSWERILSGPGLVSLYRFLCDTGRGTESVAIRDRLATGDGAAIISRAALDGADALCVAALDLFVRILGAKAGNFALDVLALGGVFLAGGIPPKILPKLDDGRFLEAFLDKGRHRALLARMPVHVALAPEAALLGAARLAAALAGEPVSA